MPTPTRARTTAAAGVVLPMRRTVLVGYAVALVALPLAAAIGWAVAGAAGAWGGLLGIAVPVGFLSVTAVVALATARLEPAKLGAAVLGSWLLKVILLIAVLAALRPADFYSRGVFFAAFVVATVGYLVLEAVVVTRTRTPYVEPGAP